MRSARVLVLAALAVVGSGWSLRAQCGEPNFGSSIGIGDDVVLPIQSLGFAFPFGGATYTDVHVSTNGFVYLSNAGVPAPGGALCCAGSTAALVAGSPKIAPMWNDHVMVSGIGSVKYNALPGKVAITWENAVEFGSTAPQQQYTFQLQLLATGDIWFTYDSRCLVATAGDCLVGMSEGNAAAVPAASDFSTTGVSTTTTNYELFNNGALTYDLAGQALLFVPSAPGYVWIPQPCTASAQSSYGTGCYTAAIGSFYELFTNIGFDLANSSMTMLRTATGYTMVGGVATYVAPTGAATALALTDDSQTTVALSSPFPYAGGTTSTLSVCSNGYISVSAAGNGTSFTPSVATMLAAANTGFWCWHDFNPAAAGSGQVKFEQVGSVAYITWDGVYSFGTTHPETFQYQVDTGNGNVSFVWQSIGGFGNGFLVGYSGGGLSAGDPGSIDISAALPLTFSVGGNDLIALALSSTGTAAGSTVVYTTSNIPEFAPGVGLYVALNMLSLGQIPAPGIDLGFLGAPGCAALVQSLDFAQSMVGASSTQTVNFPLPLTAPLGLQFFSQSAALITPNSLANGQNAFGLTTSNAIAATIGQW